MAEFSKKEKGGEIQEITSWSFSCYWLDRVSHLDCVDSLDLLRDVETIDRNMPDT